MIRRISGIATALLLITPLFFLGCRNADNAWTDAKSGQKKVLVSFAPLYCFAQNVAGDDACVLCLLTTQGPHDYESSHRDMLKARDADVIFVNGLELDDFVMKLATSSGNQRAEIVKVGDALPHEVLIHNEHDAEADKGADCCQHGEHDPHIWLHPGLAQRMVDTIAAKLSALDPEHAAGYRSRADAYKAELQKLQAYGEAAFKDKKNRKLIAQHESLRYFCEAFKLTLVDTIQPRPGMEADARKMAELVKTCQEQKVSAICIEPQYSRKAAEALASQLQHLKADVRLVEVDPLETAPGSPNPDPSYYLERMRQNIDQLAKALP